jgi:hypothetical protein
VGSVVELDASLSLAQLNFNELWKTNKTSFFHVLALLLTIKTSNTRYTMSFGFGIGDFITVIELASKVRKEFVHAPSQFKAISDECVF